MTGRARSRGRRRGVVAVVAGCMIAILSCLRHGSGSHPLCPLVWSARLTNCQPAEPGWYCCIMHARMGTSSAMVTSANRAIHQAELPTPWKLIRSATSDVWACSSESWPLSTSLAPISSAAVSEPPRFAGTPRLPRIAMRTTTPLPGMDHGRPRHVAPTSPGGTYTPALRGPGSDAASADDCCKIRYTQAMTTQNRKEAESYRHTRSYTGPSRA